MNTPQAELKVGAFQVALLILTVLILAGLAADTLWVLPAEVSNLIQWTDTVICLILLTDFFARLSRAESKLDFLKWGWIDLLASIPTIDALRWGRAVRVLRVLRLLRGIRSLHRVVTLLFQDKLQAGAVSLGLITFLLISFSSISVLICEQQEGGNIKTAEDAVWWSISTVTTVGYGDKYPTTTEGRILGMGLMLSGIGVFGGLSGLLASVVLGKRRDDTLDTKEVLARLEALQTQMDAWKREAPKSG